VEGTYDPYQLLSRIPWPRRIAAHGQLQLRRWLAIRGRHGHFSILQPWRLEDRIYAPEVEVEVEVDSILEIHLR